MSYVLCLMFLMFDVSLAYAVCFCCLSDSGSGSDSDSGVCSVFPTLD